MQPYFFPYIGYFQLIAAADKFIVYDNIKYTKKGWINRNRILQDGKDVLISLPIKKDSDYLMICERQLADDFNPAKLLNQIKNNYRRAPYFNQTFPLIDEIINSPDHNLFSYLHNAITKICRHLNIMTEIGISSLENIDHTLKSEEKVLALCEANHANMYINAIGGQALYEKDTFQARGIELRFIQSKPFEYAQFDPTFVPWLSIIDVMMFNPLATIQQVLTTNYELI